MINRTDSVNDIVNALYVLRKRASIEAPREDFDGLVAEASELFWEEVFENDERDH